ncbi:MAG: hypothetical protein HN665_00700 [Candidatus Marinimicrobia bacterium]|nr:hypothetical protein [Candidatus Neomarinimicrobiota bacterium]MBT7494936.1 hypothetical protein [Candidatus Neomarinimicrobiota bacterium]MBT7738010.1 hypothetical protein [Candidatus Neomarinimicrobiota bacterium]
MLLVLMACEDVKRVWDNPYDPRSDKSLWTPDSLTINQRSPDEIELSWFRKGRDFDGFIIDKKVGEGEWQDTVAKVWDSLYIWVDKLDLKEVVKNPVEYTYQLYAFADSNVSNKVSAKIKPVSPGPPDKVNVISVTYTNEPKMTITWALSIDGDFAKYNLYQAKDSTGTQSLIQSYNNKTIITHIMTTFDPTIENWFWVEVEDSTGQKTKGVGKGHTADSPPMAAVLDSVTYASGFFNLKWSKSNISDFDGYIIQQTNISGEIVIFSVNEPIQANTGSLMPVNPDEEQFFKVVIKDIWGQTTISNIRSASSFQRIVKVDNLTNSGDKLTIFNRGPILNFTHEFVKDNSGNPVNAYFPVWIQNGNKVFALNNNGPGLVVNKDGSNLRIMIGEEAQNYAFNPDQSFVVYTGIDHNIYLANLNKDVSPSQLTATTNNEWYGDPEFIENGDRILYWQRQHQSNNNVGVTDIFSMDLDGKNVKQITQAQNFDKLIMPRMSPDGTKILYVKEGDGLYILNYPNESIGVPVTKSDGEKIIPETSKYFKNMRWSSDSKKAILWTYKNDSYFLYVFELGASPELTLLQTGGHYADWLYGTNNDTVIFKSESSKGMFTKAVNASSSSNPSLFFDGDWAQLQPRQ